MRDVEILRPLAYQYAQAAQSDMNDKRRTLHRAVNDLKMIRPVVLINEIPFHEINFDGSLTCQCEDKDFLRVERFFRMNLFQWKYFPADMILTPYYPVRKIIHNEGIGINVQDNTIATDKNNNIVSHEYIDQIETEEALAQIKMPVISYDEAATKTLFNKIANAIGDIIPVMICGTNAGFSMWDQISYLRGVTPLLIDLAERPEFSHAVVRKFTDIAKCSMEQYEKLGLFDPNPTHIHCTSALNSTLPGTGDNDGGPVKRSQCWGRGAAQIFASVSKYMREEYDIEYMKEVMEPFGLNYYGCCEPLDKQIDVVSQLPHLRKISITPWADVDIGAEAIGDKYVLANKPNPSAVATVLDEDALRKEIGRTIDACRRNNCSFEMTLKDISSVGYRMENLVRWEQIVMEMVNNY